MIDSPVPFVSIALRGLLVVLALTMSACTAPAFVTKPGDTVLADVSVIRGDGTAAIAEQSVVVRGERIAWIGPANDLRIGRDARRLPVSGSFVVPGFIDMHAHITVGPTTITMQDGMPVASTHYDAQVARVFAGQLLDHGITTIRNPAGPAMESVALRDAVAAGEVRGPRMFTAGEVLEAAPFPGLATEVHTAADVQREVARQAALGVDRIKLYQFLTPDLLKAGIDAAHAHGLPAIGHLMATDWTTAAELGIDGIVHMLPASPELLPAAERKPYRDGITGTQMTYQWFEHADLDAPEIARMIATLARERVHFDPTLVAVESMFFGDETRITKNPALASVPAALRDTWSAGFTLTPGWSARDFERSHAAFEKALRLTKRMHDGGVLLLAGTDLCMPWLAAGDSLHRELELLVDAGIAPAEVLRIATLNGATALGIDAEVGTVEAGKRADLVVLGANPHDDIRNTRRIRHVIQDGVVVATREDRT